MANGGFIVCILFDLRISARFRTTTTNGFFYFKTLRKAAATITVLYIYLFWTMWLLKKVLFKFYSIILIYIVYYIFVFNRNIVC